VTANSIFASKENIANLANMMSFNISNAAIMALKGDVSNANVLLVSLIGIDTYTYQ